MTQLRKLFATFILCLQRLAAVPILRMVYTSPDSIRSFCSMHATDAPRIPPRSHSGVFATVASTFRVCRATLCLAASYTPKWHAMPRVFIGQQVRWMMRIFKTRFPLAKTTAHDGFCRNLMLGLLRKTRPRRWQPRQIGQPLDRHIRALSNG